MKLTFSFADFNEKHYNVANSAKVSKLFGGDKLPDGTHVYDATIHHFVKMPDGEVLRLFPGTIRYVYTDETKQASRISFRDYVTWPHVGGKRVKLRLRNC